MALRRRPRKPTGERSWDYLFIVTYGRSGSTLLQGILNSIDGYVIRGENGGAVRDLWQYQATLSSWRRQRKKPIPLPKTHAWWGIDGFDESLCAELLRDLVDRTILRPPVGTRVAGFKEVRYLQPDTPDYIDWMSDTFPGARFVFNFRDLTAVAKSAWWQDDPEASSRLHTADAMLVRLQHDLGESRSHAIRYDDYVDDVDALRPLFKWLGEPFDPQVINSTMKKRHSY